MTKLRTLAILGLAAGGLAVLSSPSNAAANLINNGDFEITSGFATQSGGTSGTSGLVNTTNVTGWSGTGLNVLYNPGQMDTTGAYAGAANGTVYMWGSNDGGTTVLPASSATGNSGGNFIALDGDKQYSGPLTQSVSGLTTGMSYTLSFLMAGAQEKYNYGATTESFQVTFGSQILNSQVINTPSQGFSGWRLQTLTFIATSAQQTLSFLAVGTPSGAPPFSLLDSVSLVAAPEPATWGIMLVGLAGVTVLLRTRRTRRDADGAV